MKIDNEREHEYFEKDNSIYILYETDALILEKTGNNQLKGTSKKVKKYTFVSSDNEFKYGPKMAGADKRVELIEQFYQVNYVNADKLFKNKGKGNFKASMQIMKKENQKLCDLDLDLACMQIFVYGVGKKSLDVISVLFDSSKKEVEKPKEDAELEKLEYKINELGNPEGYGLLYSYFTLIDQEDKAEAINDKGIKEGCKMCVSNKELY